MAFEPHDESLEQPTPPASPASKTKGSVDGIVDELKKVLSNLNSVPAQAPTPLEKTPPPPPMPTPVSEPSAVKHEQPFFKQPEASPSDADFWKGDVLGWGNDPEPKTPPVQPAPRAPEPVAEPVAELEDPFVVSQPPTNTANAFREEPMPEPQPVETPTAIPTADPWFQPNMATAEQILPPPPPPPISIVDEKTKGGFAPPPPPPQPEIFHSLDSFDPSSTPAAPIPGTVEKEPAHKNGADPADESQMKPEGLVQVACIFPEGQEHPSQQFISKLKEIGEKAKKKLNIQPVFINGWSADRADVKAWRKSASLSGADIMFVISAKKDADLFKDLSARPFQDGIQARLVYLEQLNSRALYADIMIELSRGK